MSMFEINKTLKEALYETLLGVLAPHREVRVAAEQRIEALEVTEGTSYVFHLLFMSYQRVQCLKC